jgi:hypothetical protein
VLEQYVARRLSAARHEAPFITFKKRWRSDYTVMLRQLERDLPYAICLSFNVEWRSRALQVVTPAT